MRRNLFVLALVIAAMSCKKNNNDNDNKPMLVNGNFQQVNLVANKSQYSAGKVDTSLRNAWGIAVNPANGVLWISSNHAGVTTVYDSTGKTLLAPVAIPSQGNHFGGSPTGMVFNSTTNFVIPANAKVAKFIFANEDGTISAWSGGDSTLTVINRSSSDAVYKGLAIANDGSNNFLYAANFKGNKIDVFDNAFNMVTNKSFSDPGIPAGFAPFNIANIGGKLYVTYAKLEGPDNEDDQPGHGNGYVDIFNPDGTLVRRFASQGNLNSPWGIAAAPNGSGLPQGSILIGNFGDGQVNVFDASGNFNGVLQNNGNPVVIPGLWALDFLHNEYADADPTKLYFTAGPAREEDGVFGYLKIQ